MYDKLNKITFDGCEYYYNNGIYTLVFDGAEGGRIWIYRITKDDLEVCKGVPYELWDEFIKFANYIKNLENKEK